MAIKKHRNTFEGGIDQDTAFKLVPSNRYYKAKGFSLTKDGKTGSLTTPDTFDVIGNVTPVDQPTFVLTLNSTINSSTDIITLGSTVVTASANITNLVQLYNELIAAAVSGFSIYRNNINIYIYGNAVSDINSNLTVITLGSETTFNNLGIKEIILDNGFRLILMFRKVSNVFYVQVFYYNNTFERRGFYVNAGIIWKGFSPTSIIQSSNIIYNKESPNKHKFYWCDGINSDKSFTINSSLDPTKYANFATYIETLRVDLYKQSNNKFDEITLNYFPRPEVTDMNIINSETILDVDLPLPEGISAAETVLFFYRLKIDGKFSNISNFSRPWIAPTNEILLDSDNLFQDFHKLVPQNHVDLGGINGTTEKNKWSVTFTVEDLNTLNYNFLEPYVIHYDINNNYKIRKFNDININEGTVDFTYKTRYDSETSEEIDIISLLNLNSKENISQEQIIFKNRRIKANVKDNALDIIENFDSRAYRFTASSGTQEAVLYDINGNEEVTIDGTSGTLAADFVAIDKQLDAINKFNDEYTDYSDWGTNQQYKFKANGTTVGGEGPNISYTFVNEKIEECNVTATPTTVKPGFRLGSTFSTTLKKGKSVNNSHRGSFGKKSFTGGEVYRFFIFFWKEDQPTLAKWIGDIKFPENDTIVNSSSSVYSKNIEFVIDTSTVVGEVSAVSIGFVPRTLSDMSVLYTGSDAGMDYGKTIASTKVMYFDDTKISSDNIYDMANIDSTNYNSYNSGEKDDIDDDLSRMFCLPLNLAQLGLIQDFNPTTYFVKKLAYMDYTHFKTDFDGDGLITDGGYNLIEVNNSTAYSTQELVGVTKFYHSTHPEFSFSTHVIDISKELTLNTVSGIHPATKYDVGGGAGVRYLPNLGFGGQALGGIGPKTFMLLNTKFSAMQSLKMSLFSVRRKIENQYNGPGNSARITNTIEMGSYTKLNNEQSLTIIPEGDTFVTYPDIVFSSSKSSLFAATNFYYYEHKGYLNPVETVYNVHSRFAAIVPNSSEEDSEAVDQTRYWSEGVLGYINYDANLTRFTPWQTVKKLNNILKTTTISITNNVVSKFNSKFNISEKKIIGETNDSWLDFKVNNSKILDPIWGTITKLVDEKDRLFIFQEDAVAQQYVEQVQQQIDNVSQISLGTGDVAGQHIYILKNIGAQDNRQVLQLPDDVLFRDVTRGKLYSINHGEVPGLSKLLLTDRTSSETQINRTLLYDRDTNIVFIPNYNLYDDSSDSTMIIYDNNIKKIICDATYVAEGVNTFLYSGLTNLIHIDSAGDFSLYNRNKFIEWPNNTLNRSIVEFIINPEPETVKTFDNLFINFEATTYDTDGLPIDDADFEPLGVSVSTQYQVGASSPINPFVRKGRYWRYTIPRDTNGARIRDYWCKVQIMFNTSAIEIELKEVITSYRHSNLK